MKVVFTVTNDLTYDQRMARICQALSDDGIKVELIGRKKKGSALLQKKEYKQTRLNCWFTKGKLFYLEYNFRLFVYLSFARTDVFCAIDLDTILPNLFASWLRGKKLGYDAHEYFTEMEELTARPTTQKLWKAIEQFSLPKIDFGYTISNGYKALFEKEYPIKLEVIRNVNYPNPNLPQSPDRPVILYQGAVNIGRGLEETVEAMQYLDAQLLICGEGDIFHELKSKVKALGLTDKVVFKGYVSPEELKRITPTCTIGLTLFTNDGLHNKQSLCNRFFDYYLAGLPQLTISYDEYVSFNQEFEVSHLINKIKVGEIEKGLNFMLQNPDYLKRLRVNCIEAAKKVNWETEKLKLINFYRGL